ncbi:uncharacterized protein C8R40DRAFT_1070024 [Lentinula edodes]|uniref:uncharacterized protein n=1 Tax=Lentinula edodes TaxID=5353 RepID=UPI001E8D498D|nr:uncharacterized protein C8R40DRAFT_1070024 [Lentinula edodes]KAH7874680.1 hypothetical protein C8R40DRAFT_1070024 [Lentinula edodes]
MLRPKGNAGIFSPTGINIHGGLVVDVLHIHLITYDISLNIFSLAQYERFQDTWRNRGNSPPPWSNLPAISIEHLGDDTRSHLWTLQTPWIDIALNAHERPGERQRAFFSFSNRCYHSGHWIIGMEWIIVSLHSSWTQRQNAFPSDVTGFYCLSNDEDDRSQVPLVFNWVFRIVDAYCILEPASIHARTIQSRHGWRSFGSDTFGFRLSSGIWNRAAILPPALSFHDDRKDPFRKFLRGSILESEELTKRQLMNSAFDLSREVNSRGREVKVLSTLYWMLCTQKLRFRNRWKIPPLQERRNMVQTEKWKSRTKEEGRVTRSLDTELIYVKSLLRKCHHVPEADRVTSREKVKYLVQERE